MKNSDKNETLLKEFNFKFLFQDVDECKDERGAKKHDRFNILETKETNKHEQEESLENSLTFWNTTFRSCMSPFYHK